MGWLADCEAAVEPWLVTSLRLETSRFRSVFTDRRRQICGDVEFKLVRVSEPILALVGSPRAWFGVPGLFSSFGGGGGRSSLWLWSFLNLIFTDCVSSSLKNVPVDKGGSIPFFPSTTPSCLGDRVGSEALLLSLPSDNLTRDSPEDLEYAERRLDTDPVGDGRSGATACFIGATGRLGIDIVGSPEEWEGIGGSGEVGA